MAISFNPLSVLSGFDLTKLNQNFQSIKTALTDGLSRSGGSPNQMNADIDMNSNDLLNVKQIDAEVITLNGEVIQPVTISNALKSSNALSELNALGLQAEARDNIDAAWENDPRIVNALQPGAESTQIDYTDNRTGGISLPLFNTIRKKGAMPEYFGAVGDGIADDTVAFQKALDTGDKVIGGDGSNYRVTQLTMHDSQTIEGSDSLGKGTIITAGHATNDILIMQGNDMEVSKIFFKTAVTRTAGNIIRMGPVEASAPSGSYHKVRDCAFLTVPDPIKINTNNRADVADVKMFDCSGALYTVVGGFNHQIVGARTLNDPGSMPTYGVYVKEVGDLLVSGGQFLRAGNCMFLDVDDGKVIASVGVSDTYFDSALRGLWVRSTNTGQVTRCDFRGTWFGGHTQQGVLIQKTSTGGIDGLLFDNCKIVLNGDAGLTTSGTVTDIHINGGSVAQNTAAGISWGNGARKVSACPDVLGAGDGLLGNGTGVFIDTNVDQYLVAPKTFSGNTTQINNSSAAAAEGQVRGAVGFKVMTRGSAGIGAAVAFVDVAHGLPATPNDYDIKLTPVTSQLATTRIWISNVGATTFRINADPVPGGAGFFCGWEAKHPLFRG